MKIMKSKVKNSIYRIPSAKQYATLQLFAGWCKSLSQVILFLTVLALFGFLVVLSEQTTGSIIFLIFNFLSFLTWFLFFVFFRILSEMIWVHLDTTMNTYHAAIIVEQLLRSKR